MHTVPVCNAFDKNDYRHIKKGFAKILGNVNGFANKQLGVVKMTSCKEPPYYVNCDGFLHESNQHTNQGHEYSSTNKRLIFLPYLQLITFHYQTWVWSLPTNSLTISLWRGVRSDAQLSSTETRFQKCSQSGKNGSKHPMLSISMAYNVISCKKVERNTQKLKTADFTM